jgi:formate/nitrite transporter
MSDTPASHDALLPAEMALKAEAIGVKKAGLDFFSTLALGVLAGAFIAMGAVFSTTVMADPSMSFGWRRLLGGIVFSVGLIFVIVGGAELFTGNTLIVMAWAGRKVKTARVLRNWGIVYLGNFIGAAATALLVFWAGHYQMNGELVGRYAVDLAEAKCEAGFFPLLVKGVLGNAMVCLAVWLAFSARTTIDRVAVIVPPIAMFVAAGFEHCVANMYYIPSALLIRDLGDVGGTASGLNAAGLIKNLAAVTLGNIIGGAGLVGAMYWFIYLRPRRSA